MRRNEEARQRLLAEARKLAAAKQQDELYLAGFLLEQARGDHGACVVVVIAGHRQARQGILTADAEQSRRPFELRLEAQICRVTGKDHVIGPALSQLRHQRPKHLFSPPEAVAPPEHAHVDPTG